MHSEHAGSSGLTSLVPTPLAVSLLPAALPQCFCVCCLPDEFLRSVRGSDDEHALLARRATSVHLNEELILLHRVLMPLPALALLQPLVAVASKRQTWMHRDKKKHISKLLTLCVVSAAASRFITASSLALTFRLGLLDLVKQGARALQMRVIQRQERRARAAQRCADGGRPAARRGALLRSRSLVLALALLGRRRRRQRKRRRGGLCRRRR